MIIKKMTYSAVYIISIFFLMGCHSKGEKLDSSLTSLKVNVVFASDAELPKNARLEVLLEDVSKADVASEIIGSATREITKNPPYQLQLYFPHSQVKNNHRYSLRASIKVAGKLHFISTTHIDPFAVGISTPVQIKVEKVGG